MFCLFYQQSVFGIEKWPIVVLFNEPWCCGMEKWPPAGILYDTNVYGIEKCLLVACFIKQFFIGLTSGLRRLFFINAILFGWKSDLRLLFCVIKKACFEVGTVPDGGLCLIKQVFLDRTSGLRRLSFITQFVLAWENGLRPLFYKNGFFEVGT